jgi:hypothetical protein
MTQETTPAPQEVEAGLSEADAASELLKRWGATEQTPTEEPESTEEPEQMEAEEAKPEAEEEAEEQPEESEEVEIDVAGEKYKLPAQLAEQAKVIEAKVKEIEAGATRKFQEAAELRKVAEAQTEHAKQIGQLSQAKVEHLADLRTIDRRLQQLASMDINAIAESDPAMLARLTAESQQLQFARGRVIDAIQQTSASEQQVVTKADAEKIARMQTWAEKNIKGWSGEYDNALMDFCVKTLGADKQTMVGVLLKGGEPMLKALDLAYKGWKVQSTDPKAKQVVATKTLKPGAAGQVKSNAQATAETAMRRLAQTKSVGDAAAALLARSNASKRR